MAAIGLLAVGAVGVAAAWAAVAAPADPALGSPAGRPADSRIGALAADAYVWGYPSVDLYSILHGQVLDPKSSDYKAPLNRIGHSRNVATPDDKVVIAPNVDTPYSHAWLDLRDEPVVITIPPFEDGRYVSLQLFDLYTWIVGYVTPRTNGRVGGDFLVAREAWQGTPPPGIRQVFRVPTDLALAMFRTQLFDAADLPKVHALQDRYRVRTLSEYLGRPARPARALPPLVAPVNLRTSPTDPAFFDVLGWMLHFMPPLPAEQALRREFASIGIAAGGRFGTTADAATRAAATAGMQAALARLGERARRVRSSSELFGSREFLGTDYLARATGAMLGILGNSAEEFLGVGYQRDARGDAFDGARRYRIRFAPDGLPPVGAFWSITVYTPQRLLYANPLRRYVINSPMLPQLARDADGGLTLHLQHESPGAALERNWLPVPRGEFVLTFRTYEPGAAIRDGRWSAPPVTPLP